MPTVSVVAFPGAVRPLETGGRTSSILRSISADCRVIDFSSGGVADFELIVNETVAGMLGDGVIFGCVDWLVAVGRSTVAVGGRMMIGVFGVAVAGRMMAGDLVGVGTRGALDGVDVEVFRGLGVKLTETVSVAVGVVVGG